jgi:hypothetical protein
MNGELIRKVDIMIGDVVRSPFVTDENKRIK